VEGRHERRALPAGSDVAAAEIGDDIDAGELGEERRRVQLHRVAARRAGAMANRLAVRTDRGDLGTIDRCAAQDGIDDRSSLACQRVGGDRCAVDFVGTALVESREFGAQPAGKLRRAWPRMRNGASRRSSKTRRRRRQCRRATCPTSARRRVRGAVRVRPLACS
jgi:hypothetical protein